MAILTSRPYLQLRRDVVSVVECGGGCGNRKPPSYNRIDIHQLHLKLPLRLKGPEILTAMEDLQNAL